ncbi:MAG: GerAB/ArcD/ProY family transporter [Tumebacillaceae bacterium]
MEVNVTPPKRLLFSVSFLMLVIHKTQVGVGVLGFQRIVIKESDHDAWISVLIAGLLVHLSTWVMIKTLRLYESTDLFGIHYDVFGKWLGGLLSFVWILFFASGTFMIIQTYIEAVQTWIFPDFPNWMLSCCLVLLVLYGVLGGVRVIVGACMISFLLTIWMVLLVYYPLHFAVWTKLLPVMEAPIGDLLRGAHKMGLTVLGFEMVYVLYPFVNDKSKVQKYSHLGVLITNLLYIASIVTVTVYFSREQVLRNIWAQLSILKIIQFPFLERFEYVIISLWVLVILPNMLLYTWAATRGVKRVFGANQRKSLFVICALIFLANFLIHNRAQVNQISDFLSNVGVYLTFLYPFVLYAAALIRKKRRAKGAKQVEKAAS